MNVPAHQFAELTRDELRKLADQPIDNAERASKTWLPLGKRSNPRGPKPVYENEFAPAITAGEARARRADEQDKKLATILDYYATTSIPFERIAEHTKLDMVKVIRVMKARGRDQ